MLLLFLSCGNKEQNVEDDEEAMAATSSIAERTRYWNSARVRHSPPPPPLSPAADASVVSPRAKSCHASLSHQHDTTTAAAANGDSDEIIEEIENVLDAIGISSEEEEDDDDPPRHATFYR